MATERIIIEVQARGIRTVNRNLNNLERSSRRSVSILQQLRNALVVVAAVRVIRRFTDLADSFTNLENRLRSTLGGLEAARAAQASLIRISLETRTGIDATGDAFARLALGAKDLGLSTETLLGVTRTLNQAIILSGATAQEARNAMIQLSQGIASGALRGDELRAVLEQLPLVARIIADEFDVPIGQLRRLGEEGLLTTDRLIQAFEAAGPRIEEAFGQTVVTIDQALTNLTTQFTVFLDEFSRASGVGQALASSLQSVADAFGFLAENIAIVNGALATLAAGAGLLALGRLAALIASLRTIQLAFLATAGATGILSQAVVFLTTVVRLLTIALLANPFTLVATAIALGVGAIVAYDSATTSLTEKIESQNQALEESNRLLQANEAISREVADRNINNLLAQQREIEQTLRESETIRNIRGTTVRSSTLTNEETAQLRGQLEEIKRQLQEFEAAARDAESAARLLGDATGNVFDDEQQQVLDRLNFELAQFGRSAREAAIAQALFKNELDVDDTSAFANEIRRLSGAIFDAAEAERERTRAAREAERLQRERRQTAQQLFSDNLTLSQQTIRIDAELAAVRRELVQITQDQATADAILAGERARLIDLAEQQIAPAALEFLESQKTLTERIADAEEEAITIKNELIRLEFEEAEATRLANVFLQEQIDLLKEREAAAGQAIVDRFFTSDANQRNLEQARQDLARARDVPGGITAEQEAAANRLLRRETVGASNAAMVYTEALKDLAAARQENAITAEEELRLARLARIELLESERTLGAGAERAFLNFIDDATDAATQTEQLLTNAFSQAEDALVEFVNTGKLSFDDLFRTIADGLIRLAIQQTFAGIGGFAGGQFGIGGPSSTGGIGGLVAGLLPAFQNGGQFTVGANSSLAALPGIDNRLVAFRARDGEEVTVTPRDQPVAGGVPITLVQNITTRDADSFKRTQSQLGARAVAGLNQARRRR